MTQLISTNTKLTNAQNEAFINEYKGNLFEFLVASALAKHYKIEADFLTNFNPSLFNKLREYEKCLRDLNYDVLLFLRELAPLLSDRLKLILPDDINNIVVVGKFSSHKSIAAQINEADLILSNKHKELPISIKFSKAHAFVNTKSGGFKSFVAKYFRSFKSSEIDQQIFNSKCHALFIDMFHQLYQMAGLDFFGKVDEQWANQGLPELPGKLNASMHAIVMHTYQLMTKELYFIMHKYYLFDLNMFTRCLYALIGVGDTNIIQATCFYSYHQKNNKYSYHSTSITSLVEHENFLKKIEFPALKKKATSFEIHLNEVVLQIRPKPMNKFSVPAFKVNCSIKLKRFTHEKS